MKVTTWILLILSSVSIVFASAPVVGNVSFNQRTDGSKIVDVYYDLSDSDNDICNVSMLLSDDDGETYSIIPNRNLLIGDIGELVSPGTGKHFIWYAGAEHTILVGNTFRVKVIAEDGTPPLIPDNFIFMPGRTFIMGRTVGTGDTDELPLHNVTLSPYAICKYEVTQGEWQTIMGENPASGYGVGVNYPVYNISWYDIIKYCNLRSIAQGYLPAYTINGSADPNDWGDVPAYDSPPWNATICNWHSDGYRLPTDAEWEFAARGGTNNPDYIYSGSNTINNIAWYGGNNTTDTCKPVGTKAANGIGIYDMSGNLWEYCWDWLGDFLGIDETDPTGVENGFIRIARGGYWLNNPAQCRVAERSGYYAFEGSYWMGFRLAKSLPDGVFTEREACR